MKTVDQELRSALAYQQRIKIVDRFTFWEFFRIIAKFPDLRGDERRVSLLRAMISDAKNRYD